MLEKIDIDDKDLAEAKARFRRFAKTTKFFKLLFGVSVWVSFRLIGIWTEGGRKFSRVNYDQSRCKAVELLDPYRLSMLDHLAERKLENVFFGCAPRFGSKGFEESWQIRTIPFLWVDIDNCSVEEAKERCQIAGLSAPSIIVNSGNGVHIYWLLESPYLIDDAGDPPQVKKEWATINDKRRPIQFYIDPDDVEKIYLTNARRLLKLD